MKKLLPGILVLVAVAALLVIIYKPPNSNGIAVASFCHHRWCRTTTTTTSSTPTITSTSTSTTSTQSTTTTTTSTTSTQTGAPDTPILGTTYYVSPSGSDSNSGTSPSTAWLTVARVNRATLHPGDGVLFQGGSTYSDDLLTPGFGTDVSGTAQAPVVFGSYGLGRAYLPKGAWTKGESYIVFQELQLGGPDTGLSGTGSYITLQNSVIKNVISDVSHVELGIVIAGGSNYVIRNNVVDHTGDSGMLLEGDHYRVENNTISNTGLDLAVNWGAHGIYLKAPDSSVTGNTITNFQNEGVSVRYRNSLVSHNTIDGGQYGIAWHQYDTIAGTSSWSDNSINHTSILGIYVSRHDIGGYTMENFIFTNNTLYAPNPIGNWLAFELDTTSSVIQSGNVIQ